MKRAIIDLGTNTFHLLIVNASDKLLFKTSVAARIGMGGITKGIITDEGIARAIVVLSSFRDKIAEHNILPENVFAFGTSALRNAKNQKSVLQQIEDATGIYIQVISGEREAELIYKGVSLAVSIKDTSLIVDIGGGSVEFVICNANGILWKRSLEIGGQRMLELFLKTDPISYSAVSRLDDYLRENLLPLTNACHQYAPKIMIGSSGSFDTLNEMHYHSLYQEGSPTEQIGFGYPISAFKDAYEQLLTKNRRERMNIAGMIELRVDMIVVAICLIRYLIQTFDIEQIKISKYAMKEGILALTRS